MPKKRVEFDDETWSAIHLLLKDRMMEFQELAEEAFNDVLRKHDRPTDFNAAMRKSLKSKPSTKKKSGSRRSRKLASNQN